MVSKSELGHLLCFKAPEMTWTRSPARATAATTHRADAAWRVSLGSYMTALCPSFLNRKTRIPKRFLSTRLLALIRIYRNDLKIKKMQQNYKLKNPCHHY